jgi:hypothetical protein
VSVVSKPQPYPKYIIRFPLTPATSPSANLREAWYFLERMRENASSDRDSFTLSLRAFLGAARSVRDILGEEYRFTGGFEEWWGTKRQADWLDPE